MNKSALLEEFAALSDDLFDLGVIRTDSFTGEIGEYVVAHYYGLDRTKRSERGVDATAKNGERYQVKSKVISDGKFSCTLKKLNPSLFDYLVVIYFDNDYRPLKAMRIASKYLSCDIAINNKSLQKIPHDILDEKQLLIDSLMQQKITQFGKLHKKLHDNDLTGSRRIVGDVGERFAVEKLNLMLCDNKIQKGFDAVDNDGRTYEIKTRRVYKSGRREGTGYRINGLEGKSAEFLIVVVLDEGFQCNGMWKMPLTAVKNPTNAHLRMVKNTPNTEIIVPTTIPWLK